MKATYYFCFILLCVTALGSNSCDKTIDDPVTGFILQEIIFSEGNGTNSSTLIATIQGEASTDISYRIEEGSAKFGTDIKDESGTLTLADGKVSVPSPVIGDEFLELEETFKLVFEVDGKDFIYEITIQDDDSPGEVLEDQDGYYTPTEYPSMELAWSEEFDGVELDEATWTYELGNGCDKGLCGWGNNELQEYTKDPKNIRVADGSLTIEATQIPGGYNSARIITQDKVELTFGRMDIRAKMPKGQGIWPAIWMLGANIDDVSWPMCGEIDIMELVGHTAAVTHGTVHYDNGNGYATSTGSRSLTTGDLSDQFHVYSLVWNKNEIIWYLDNIQFKKFTKTGSETYPFNDPFFFIMNIAVGGNWPGSPDGTTVFPQTMVVDYIRVFN